MHPLADDGMYKRAEIRRMNAALKKSLANGDMIDAAQHRHFLKILMEGAEADTPLVPDQADGSDDDGSSAVHSDHDQGGQNPPSCDLSQNIFSSIHSISPKFRERSGNGQTWLNPKFE